MLYYESPGENGPGIVDIRYLCTVPMLPYLCSTYVVPVTENLQFRYK